MTDTVIDIPPEQRVAFAARNLRTLVVDGFLLVRQLGGASLVAPKSSTRLRSTSSPRQRRS
jgi:hypothetical protein